MINACSRKIVLTALLVASSPLLAQPSLEAARLITENEFDRAGETISSIDDDTERNRLNAELAAAEIRFALHDRASLEDRQSVASDALERIEALLPLADHDLRRRLAGDRLLALLAVGRAGDAGDVYQELLTDPDPWRSYVHDAGGAALLRARRPQLAVAAYRRVLALEPENDDAALGIFYGLVESEELDGALAFARTRAKEVSGTASRHRLWRLMSIRALAYSDRLNEAERELDRLRMDAPEDAELEELAGRVLQWEGRPSRAMEHYRRALTLDPDSMGAHEGVITSSLARRRFATADRVLAELRADSPAVDRIARIDREIALAKGWSWHSEFSIGDSSASNGPLGSRDRRSSFRVSTPLFGSRWRIAADGADHYVDDPRAGKLTFRQGAIGVEAIVGALQADLGYSAGDASADGWRLALDLAPVDRWALGLEIEEEARDLPLRARTAGVGASRVAFGSRLVLGAERVLALSFQAVDFSDGNHRREVGLNYRHRWRQTARWRLSGSAGLYRSENDESDRPYFNPRRDLSVDTGLDIGFLTWRRYEKAFYQNWQVGLGSYDQDGFGTGEVISASYGHRWRWPPATELRYDIAWSSRPYDGDREERLAISMALGLRVP